jgi:hypothetical protein
VHAIVLVICLVCAGSAAAADPDTDALSLADQAPASTKQSKDWRLAMEAAYAQTMQRIDRASAQALRLSLDFSLDTVLAPDLRVVLADRLDATREEGQGAVGKVNTLKEAYGSLRLDRRVLLDLGRVNVRSGVAVGYNPTDFFRTGAVRSLVSLDPESLRSNRLGSVMGRGQALWDSGSVTMLYSPRLADQPSSAALDPDLGATNRQNRWLVTVSQKLAERWQPQFLLYGGAGMSPVIGVNQTASLGNATVAYLEWSGGRGASLASQAMVCDGDTGFRSRLATGLTYTTEHRQSVTVEYEYSGVSMDRAQWDALRYGSPGDYSRYRAYAQSAQELLTRHALFFYGAWKDVGLNQLDLNAMVRVDLIDRSKLLWLEARYHWKRSDVALRWQSYRGDDGTTFGAVPQRQIWQVLGVYYF